MIINLDSKFQSKALDGLEPSITSNIIPVETNKEGQLTKRSKTIEAKEWSHLLDFAEETVTKLSQEILSGDTQINPYQRNSQTACDYCNYRTICRFERKYGMNEYRKIEELDQTEVLNRIRNGEVEE